jgi:DNA-binding response OmpR family regulator
VHRVLIADDDAELTHALASRCRQLGLAVDTATTAMRALAQLESRPPDLAILDVDMPEGNGLAVCEMLMNNPALKNVPIIILTGKKDPTTIQRCHELRLFYVTKCADVWPRIRPLLGDLLELPGGAEAQAADSARQPVREEVSAEDALPPSQGEAIMHAVFEALDRDARFLGGADADAPADDEPSRPWVLCIDDDATFTFSLQLRLQEKGVEVLRAFAGREGYRSAFHSTAQAIILDYELPEGNGEYVMRRLKENPVTKNIPVIVLTGRRDRHIERQMYNLGAASFLTKPYDWDELWDELSRHLRFSVAESEDPLATSAALWGLSSTQ